MKKYLVILPIFVLTSCQSSRLENASDGSNLSLPSGFQAPKVQKLTGVGVNSQPALSPDGRFLAYISGGRPNHENTQVYVRTLEGQNERRVTYQDGQNAAVVFSPDSSRVLYASTTDEQKEDVHFLKSSLERISGKSKEEAKPKSFWQEQPFEIYSSFLNGSRMERLTQSMHYDSEPSIDPTDKKIVFVSAREGRLNLHMMSSNGTYLKSLTKSDAPKASPQFSKDGRHLAWVEYSSDNTVSDIFVADADMKNIKKITDSKALHLDLTWMADHRTLIFSSNRDQVQNFELYSIQLDGSCLQRLTWHSSNETEPEASHTGLWYVFTSDRSGEKQIYKSEYRAPGPCSGSNS